MADTIYTTFFADLANNTQRWDDNSTTVYRVALLGSTTNYTPNKDHALWSDVTGNGGVESNATGYARQTLGTRSVQAVPANDWAMLDAADVSFGNLNGDTIKGVVVMKRVGASDAASDRLVCCFDSSAAGFPFQCNGGPVTITLNVNGLITFEQATA